MRRLDPARLEELLRAFSRVRLLVLGDVVLDEYVFGDAAGVSPEAPVPLVRERERARHPGGAANVARNVLALGGQVDLCGLVGDDRAGRQLADLLKNLGIDPGGLVVVPGRATTRKTRIVARGQQVARLDRETREPPPPGPARRLREVVEAGLRGADGAVFEDYGKGALCAELARAALARCGAEGVPVLVDPKQAVLPFRGAEIIKPNLGEAEALSGVAITDDRSRARAAAELRRQLGGGSVVVTRGADGMSLFEGDAPEVHVPTQARPVFDVQGAGDTSAAALALARRAGASLLEAAVLANAAAGVVVGKSGTATARPAEVRERLPGAVAAALGALERREGGA